MDKVSGKLTVYFEEPFWVGVFERIEDGKLSVSKVKKKDLKLYLEMEVRLRMMGFAKFL